MHIRYHSVNIAKIFQKVILSDYFPLHMTTLETTYNPPPARAYKLAAGSVER